MDTDIALARLASGRAVPIGAECGCGVHGGPPGFVWKQAKRSMLGPPFSLQVSFTTVKCRATPIGLSDLYMLNVRFLPAILVKKKPDFFATAPCSHNTPWSNFMEESQAMRYIVLLIRSYSRHVDGSD